MAFVTIASTPVRLAPTFLASSTFTGSARKLVSVSPPRARLRMSASLDQLTWQEVSSPPKSYVTTYKIKTVLKGTSRCHEVDYCPDRLYDYDGYVMSFDEYLEQIRRYLTQCPVSVWIPSRSETRKHRPIRNDYELRNAVLVPDLGTLEVFVERECNPCCEIPYFKMETDELQVRAMLEHFGFWCWGATWNTDVPSHPLSYWSEGAQVRRLQYMLTRMGLMSLSDTDQLTGSYQECTQEAVGRFQEHCGMMPSGKYDKETESRLLQVVCYLASRGHVYL